MVAEQENGLKKHPLPLPKGMFDGVGGSTVFSNIDLKLGYWQMPIRSGGIQKAAFKTRWGLYEYLVLPFGVTNVTMQFVGMMNDLLRECLSTFVLTFLDDILVYSCNGKEHVECSREVLGKLREHRLYAKAFNCTFSKSPIEFLGQ